jgi:hypothetical protein
MTIEISNNQISKVISRFAKINWEHVVIWLAVIIGIIATFRSYTSDTLVAYGDAESHLNIAKRVVQSLTPGIAQLGGIWLPLPHVMMIPFVFFDPLWRTGLAGSIVSGFCFIITALFLFKLTKLITESVFGAFSASLVFLFNPNIQYLQSTAMTELPLILFFTMSSYFFIKYLKTQKLKSLLLAALFGCFAALCRYDGWFLIAFEAGVIILQGLFYRYDWHKIEGLVVIFSTLAGFSVILWLLWGQLILGNAFYFTQSEFSAHAQQVAWLAKGQLPAYHNLPLAFLYYFVTVMANCGTAIFFVALIGLIIFLKDKTQKLRFFMTLLMLIPFIFYVVTLYIGQSVIFIPHLTPVGYEWRLFNVRYGTMMIVPLAYFVGYIFSKIKNVAKLLFFLLLIFQFGLYITGYTSVITLDDGVIGLSHSKRPDAETFMKTHYDNGLVLMDDYARTISIIRSGVPMQNIIYIGNKPYWEESLATPEKYAKWIVMQKSDAVWKSIYDNPEIQSRLYKYFQKAYTSPEILIFKRIET